jgi:hypothetical protein
VNNSERIWIGPNYGDLRILVLGESWYGDFPDDQVTDDGYVPAYLEGRARDPMYTRMANAVRMDRRSFWEGIAFTNFVQRVGDLRTDRPTADHYREAGPRLRRLLDLLAPRGVWILGKEQAAYSEPVVRAAGVLVEVTVHPTSYGAKNSTLGASWAALLAKAVVSKESAP